jgi:hypothetical protein
MRKTLKNLMNSTTYLWLALLLIATLTACGEQKLQIAAGNHAVLEQLAEAYRKVGEQYPVQPQAMPPEGRKKFVNQVFAQAGYSYSASLIALANVGADGAKPDRRDLAELLLLPTKGLSDKALTKVYSEDELAAVKRLQTIFR